MAAPIVHPTAILDGEIALAPGVEIGPHCVLRGRISVGERTRLVGSVWIEGPAVIGARNTIYPFAALGMAPQDLKWDPARPGAGLVVGDDNVLREHVTIHRATSDTRPTRIGSHGYWMTSCHAGHDCVVGDKAILATGTMLAGVVELGDRVTIGGNVAIHQFCRVGRGAMLSGGVALNKDLPPYFMLTGTNVAGSLNVIGMRRSGMPRDHIDDVKWVYRALYRRSRPTVADAVERLSPRADRPVVADYLAFFAGTKRGICPNRGVRARGTGGGATEVEPE